MRLSQYFAFFLCSVISCICAFGALGETTLQPKIWYRFDGTKGAIATFNSTAIENVANPGVWDGVVRQYSATYAAQGVFTETWTPGTLQDLSRKQVANTSALYLGPGESVLPGTSSTAFRAYGGYVDVAADDTHSLTMTNFTVEMIFKIDTAVSESDQGWPRYLVNYAGGFGAWLDSTSIICVQIGANTHQAFSYTCDDKWHHLAFSYESATKNLRIYWDYALRANVTVAKDLVWGECLPGRNTNAKIITGITLGHGGLYGYLFSGWWDEFRVCEEVLSTSQFLPKRDMLDDDEPALTLYRYRMGDVPAQSTILPEYANCAWGFNNISDYRILNLANPGKNALVFKPDEATGPTIEETQGPEDTISLKQNNLTTNVVANACSARFNAAGKQWFGPEVDAAEMVADDFTAECIFKGQGGSIMRLRATGVINPTWGLRLYNNRIYFDYYDPTSEANAENPWADNSTTTSVRLSPTAEELTSNVWHHVALAYDKSATNVSVYLDYRLTDSFTLTTQLTVQPNASSYQLLLGMTAGSHAFYNGLIDEVRVTRGILTRDDFLSCAQLESTSLGFWHFDNSWDAETQTPYIQPGVLGGEQDGIAFSGKIWRSRIHAGADEDSPCLSTNVAMARLAGGYVMANAKRMGIYREYSLERRAFTVEGFFRPWMWTDNEHPHWLVVYLDSDNQDRPAWGLCEGTNGKLTVFFRNQYKGVAGDRMRTLTGMSTGVWHHVAMTVQEKVTAKADETGLETNLVVQVYIDYERVASIDGHTHETSGFDYYNTGSCQYPLFFGNHGGTFIMGGNSATPIVVLNEDMDEVRLSEGILTPAQFLRQRYKRHGVLIVR